jgi:hypothetical protein
MKKSHRLDLIEAPDFNTSETKSGRAVWDTRGNSSWEWQTQPGVFSNDINTQQLRALEAGQLELIERPSLASAPSEPTAQYPRLRRAGGVSGRG